MSCSLLVVSALISQSAHGAAGDEPVRQHDGKEDIIVTGERVPRTLRQTSSGVVVMTEDIGGVTFTICLKQIG